MNDPKDFKIPSSFCLFGHKFTVVIVDDMFEKEDRYGDIDHDTKLIRIQRKKSVTKTYKDNKKDKSVIIELTDETVIETLFHEMAHAILESLGECKLSDNEALVNMIGKAMLEIYLTSEYTDNKK